MSVAPLSARAAAAAHLATALRSRGFLYAAVCGGAAALVAGAAWGGPTWAVAAPALAVALALAAAAAEARRDGDFAFWSGLARSMGLSYLGRVEDGILGLTPMLAAGDRRHADAWMVGRDVWGAGLWTYIRRTGDEQQSVERTVAVIEVPEATASYPGVYLYRGLTSESARGRRRLRRARLESAAFAERYVLLCADDVDDITLRELFTPSLIVYLGEHPLAPEVEICAGTVLVAVPGHHADAGTVVQLVDCARELAQRLRREHRWPAVH